MNEKLHEEKVALVTGAAKRIGAAIAGELHNRGYRIIVHYHRSEVEAEHLTGRFNNLRSGSASCLKGNLQSLAETQKLASKAVEIWGRVDLLVNNASTFYPTAMGSVTAQQWDELLDSNLKGPFFLSQALVPTLTINGGSIVNIVDIFADRPLRNHPVYSIAKAGVAMMTHSLARELAPAIRVNGVSPGAILWPQPPPSASGQAAMLEKIPLGRLGEPADIAKTVAFLADDAPYTTGQIISVDGGRSLHS